MLVTLFALLAFAFVLFSAARSFRKTLYPIKYAEIVESACMEYGLEKSFVFAVIKCESGFKSDAVSSAGAMGLMQIMPETFVWLKTKTGEQLSESSLFEPEVSIKYGCLFYSMLLEQFGSEEEAVAAYHAGAGNVEKWLADERYSEDGKTLTDIPFSSTAAYVRDVMKTMDIYEKLYF